MLIASLCILIHIIGFVSDLSLVLLTWVSYTISYQLCETGTNQSIYDQIWLNRLVLQTNISLLPCKWIVYYGSGRVLRPSGYWILSCPPINWRHNHIAWQRPKEELEEEQKKLGRLLNFCVGKRFMRKMRWLGRG